jgi:uncharacterized membrane protein
MTTDNPSCVGPVPQDMLEILMNGIFAFAMTLIVKNNIPLPSGEIVGNIGLLVEFFLTVLFDGISFIFTFILLAVFYILSFEIMRNVRSVDRITVYTVFAFLLSILFIPLTSLIWAISDEPVPYGMFFHTNILLCGLILFFLWTYACQTPEIIRKDSSAEYVKNLSSRIIVFPITALAGIIIDGSNYSFAAIPIIFLYLFPILFCVRYANRIYN